MRKTLTALTVLAAAASLAACKPFWQHDDQPAAVATTPTEPTATDPTTTADAGKPEQTAMAETPKPEAPPAK